MRFIILGFIWLAMTLYPNEVFYKNRQSTNSKVFITQLDVVKIHIDNFCWQLYIYMNGQSFVKKKIYLSTRKPKKSIPFHWLLKQVNKFKSPPKPVTLIYFLDKQ